MMYLKVVLEDSSWVFPVPGMFIAHDPHWISEENTCKVSLTREGFFSRVADGKREGWGRLFYWEDSGEGKRLLTNETVYLMNDKGDTIDSFYAVHPPLGLESLPESYEVGERLKASTVNTLMNTVRELASVSKDDGN